MLMKYIHPHITVNIFDNSFVYEEAIGNNSLLVMPYFSSRGFSDKLKYFNNKAAFLIESGTPNFKRYGQSQYQCYNWLNGGGRLYGCRLMPDDSYYANLILNVKTKAKDVPVYEKKADGTYKLDRNGERIPLMDNSDPLNPVPVMKPGVEIKHEYISIQGLTNIRTLESKLVTLNKDNPIDAEGYNNHYLLGFNVKGKGKYGNKFSITIEPDYTLESTYDFRLYQILVQEKSPTGVLSVKEGPYQFSTFPEALALARYSLFFKSMVSEYCREIDPFFSDTIYDDLVSDIMEATKDPVSGEYTFDNPQTIDFLFGVDKRAQLYDNVVINSSGVNISHSDGIFFKSGSDGSLDPKLNHYRRDDEGELVLDALGNPIEDPNTPFHIYKTMDDLLSQFYIGLRDSSIYNTTLYEFDVAMDANFSVPIKYHLVDFCKQRGDTFCYVDSGIKASVESTLNWRKREFQVNHFMVSIQGQAFKVRDSFTNTSIEVTPCFHLSKMVPEADARYGLHMPLAGHRRGIVEGYESINWVPDEDEKEKLFLARINYIEEDINYIVRMTQLTSQFMESALARENNVRVLLKMVRSARKACKLFYHERALPETISALQGNIYSTLSHWLECKALESLSVSVSQSKYEKLRRIAHVYITCVFTSTFERFIIDFTVNAE